jgi:hypothetical protein
LLHQIAEHTLERIIERLDSSKPDIGRLREFWQLDLEIENIPAQHDQRTIGIDVHSIDGFQTQNSSSESAR